MRVLRPHKKGNRVWMIISKDNDLIGPYTGDVGELRGTTKMVMKIKHPITGENVETILYNDSVFELTLSADLPGMASYPGFRVLFDTNGMPYLIKDVDMFTILNYIVNGKFVSDSKTGTFTGSFAVFSAQNLLYIFPTHNDE